MLRRGNVKQKRNIKLQGVRAEILDRRLRGGLTEKVIVTFTRRKSGREAFRYLGKEHSKQVLELCRGPEQRMPAESEEEQGTRVAGAGK